MLMTMAVIRFLRSPLGRAGLLILLLGVGYIWAYNRGASRVKAEYELAVQAEVARQTEAIATTLKAAEARARLAEVQEAEAEAAVQQAIGAAREASNSRQVCLTEEVTDALRAIK